MKELTRFIGVMVLLLLGITGCVTGNGDIVTKEIPIGSELKGIINSGSFDVKIDPSLKGKAVLEGESNILERVDAGQNEDGVFEVAFKPKGSIGYHKTVNVRIPVVNGGTFKINGSGSIRLQGDGALNGDFDVRINGSGNIDMKLEAGRINAGVSGSGNISVSGTAKDTDVEIAGSGNYNGIDCVTEKADIRIMGSGNVYTSAKDELTASILGSGNLFYRGDPPKMSVSVSGSGRASKY